jgi:RNA helicase
VSGRQADLERPGETPDNPASAIDATETEVSEAVDVESTKTAANSPNAGGGLLGSPALTTEVSEVATTCELSTSAAFGANSSAAATFFREAKAAETPKQQVRAKTRSRVFSVMQYERHPVTGRLLITQEQIDRGTSMRSIRRFAYIWHDRDTYTEAEVKKQLALGKPAAKVGSLKGLHVHIVAETQDNYSIRQISDWFEIPSARVKIPKEFAEDEGRKPYAGSGARQKALMDFVEYLTHEGTLQGDKFSYPRDTVVANFDFGAELDEHQAKRVGGRNSDKANRIFVAVSRGEMTLREVREAEPELYASKGTLTHLVRLCRDFMLHQAPPRVRVTYYIEGGSGSGKTVLARLLSESLCPDLEPEEACFEAGSPKVALQGYGGQPCIIWDDYRAGDLLSALGGRTAVWRAFDPAPGRAEENIKNGSVRLVHSVNIVTGVTPFREFIEGLAGTYTDRSGNHYEAEDPKQAYRRVRFIHHVTDDEIEVLVNAADIGQLDDWREYRHIMTMNANLREVVQTIEAIDDEADRSTFRRTVGNRLLGEMVQIHANLRTQQPLSLDDAMASLDSIKVLEGDDLVVHNAGRTALLQAEKELLMHEHTASELAAVTPVRVVSTVHGTKFIVYADGHNEVHD